MQNAIINSLREQYEAHREAAKAAQDAMADLRAAIAAIEARHAASEPAEPEITTEARSSRKKRGEVMRIVLDCIREGYDTVRQIKAACEQRGIDLTSGSISNAISRLQAKGYIRGIPHTDRWEVGRRAAGSELEQALRDSVKAEGSKAVTLKPSESNGTAGVYPVAAVTHTAGA